MGTQRAYQLSRVSVLAIALVAALWLLLARATPAQAAGVVTNCASETDLRTKLAGGGLVTFNCNGTGSAATITVTAPLTLTSGQVTLDGGNKITLTGRNTNRIFFLNGIGSLSFTLTHIVLTKGFDANAGGCLYAAAVRVYVDDVTVQQCSTAVPAGDGGGISNLFSDFQLVNSRVLSNTSGTGGGISTSSANIISLTNSLIAANQAITGGGLSVRGGTAFITASTFYSNSAIVVGGGLYLGPTGRATVLNSSLLLNKADLTGGGGIFNGNRLTLSGSVLSGNRALAGLGGGINNQNIASVNHTTFDGNVAQVGGGISNQGSVVVTQTLFTANEAFSSGGGIRNFNALQLSASTLSRNLAFNGGGINNDRTMTVTAVTLSDNEANLGGGISNDYVATLSNVTLSGNRATANGGGLFNTSPIAPIILIHVTFSHNASPSGGGIFQGSSGITQLRSSIVAHSLSGDNCRTSTGMSASIASDDYNLSDDDSCTTHLNQTHDLNKTPAQLGPLMDNGGPSTGAGCCPMLTHLPLASSPAADAVPLGTNGCGTLITTDQRGVPRPQGNAKCDMGAVERQPGERTPVLWLPLLRR